VADWSPATGVRLVTLAPELPGGLELIRRLAAQGIVVSAGHSMATFAQAQAGFAAGTRYGTHLFNTMPPLAHREPGLPGALLATAGQVIGLIPDGTHVHPGLIKIVWAAKGPREVNLVSDAMAALGMALGRYRLNDFDVIVTEKDARLADGTLAGSVLPLDQAVRNLIAFTGCGLAEALATVTTTPADLLGIGHARGRIRPGMVADLVLLKPDLRVEATICGGEIMA
jgi:N-acetylglucosamine-6-phosphate deacetylase